MMAALTAPRREAPPVTDRPSKELTDESIDACFAQWETGGDELDATRSVQDMIAAALKMLATPEPPPQLAAPQVAAPVIALPVASTIEQAVQQVLDQLAAATADSSPEPAADSDEPAREAPVEAVPDGMVLVEPELVAGAPMTAKGPVATTAVREPAPLPENPNPSHVNLVLDDGTERIVVTVAVRGTEVNAMVRGGDEHTAAALARNAASLDHALRTGGLDLASFSSERDLDHHTPREHAREQPEPEAGDSP